MKLYVHKRNLLIAGLLLTSILSSPAQENKNALYYKSEGDAYSARGLYRKAIFSYKNALGLNSGYTDAMAGLAGAYNRIDAPEMAIELYNRVLEMDKNNLEALIGLGIAYAARGFNETAIEYLEKASSLSPGNPEAEYGAAYLYYSMGRIIWAERKIDHILSINPYHYETLLLKSDIKSDRKRFDEAEEHIKKAISSKSSHPQAHVKLGELYLRKYLNKSDADYIAEAEHALKNALLISQENYQANRLLGYVYFVKEDYKSAASYFENASESQKSSSIMFSLGSALELAGLKDDAVKYYLEAYSGNPSDTVLRTALENFLVINDYKSGHPARVMLNKNHYEIAVDNKNKNLPDEVIFYLRRALFLNPMDRESRTMLMQYYSALGYHRFYIDELKNIHKIYPEEKYENLLRVGIYERREMLYHREGLSLEVPPRDVPRVLVLDFHPGNRILTHPGAGSVIGSLVSFAMQQFGRMDVAGYQTRENISRNLKGIADDFPSVFEKIETLAQAGDIEKIDYILYGDVDVRGNYISASCGLVELARGVIIDEFNISETGRESLVQISLGIAKKVYSLIPYSGRILKLDSGKILVNLGMYDGVNPGDKLFVRYRGGSDSDMKTNEKIIFTVTESNTLLSLAQPDDPSEIEHIFVSEKVFPLGKVRARRIE